jgi:hypothetical protein
VKRIILASSFILFFITIAIAQVGISSFFPGPGTPASSGGGSPATHIQWVGSNQIGGATTCVLGGTNSTAMSALVAGHTVVGAITFNTGSGQTISSIVDNAGTPNTYTVVDTINDATNNVHLVTFGKANITGGATTLTITLTGSSGNQQCVIDEWSRGTGAFADVHGGQNQQTPGTGTDAITSGSFTTTVNNDIVWGVEAASTVFTAASGGTGFTANTAQNSMVSEYKTLATAGSTAATFTQAAATARSTAMIAIEP